MKAGRDTVWIERFPAPARSAGTPSVAVKDLIDVEGSVTTAGCRAVAERAVAAGADAACVAALRAGGARLAGKVNLHELAFGVTGVNPWYGTPENPSDPGRVPGGSSSGSAVAVATGEADLALGSDTGGSIRIPAACCGVVGLKTSHGRIPLDGVFPLAPSFDTVGPMARSVAGVVSGMALLEPGFEAAELDDRPVGRARFEGDVEIDPVVDEAVDRALLAAGLEAEPMLLEGWRGAWYHQQRILGDEALGSDRWLLEASGGEGIGEQTLERFGRSAVGPDELAESRRFAEVWVQRFLGALGRTGVLVLPTIAVRPPLLGERVNGFNLLVAPVNLAGVPALSLPVPAEGRPPVGLQLVAPHGGEERLVALAARIEAAVGSLA